VPSGEAEWNAALAARFYREEFTDRPVFLCVDEETLAAVAREEESAQERLPGDHAVNDATQDSAAEALVRAVRSRVRIREPLSAWTQDSVTWRRSGYRGPPPFLSVLAVTVLAATRVSTRNDRGYYVRLNDMLGLSGPGMPRDFDSDIQQLWLCLNDWLTRVEHGRRGLPTATNLASGYPNVGWALSQTVLRPADRSRLPLLFSALGLSPGQHVEGQLLVQGLRRWGLAGHGLSRRLTQVQSDPTLTDHLAAALATELAAWDGTLRDESGRRYLQLLLTYHQRSRAFGVAVRTPPDLARHSIRVASNADIALGEAGELQPVPVPVTAELLDGATLPSQLVVSGPLGAKNTTELRLIMTRSDVRMMVPNDGLARWVEIRPAERYRRHLVVVRSELAELAITIMASLAQDPPRRTSVPCPGGWVGYEYEPVRSAAVEGPLSMLSPRAGEIAALEGGLAISARSRLYLTAGPPDVLFDLSLGTGVLQVGGHIVNTAERSGRLRLDGRGLAEGTHEVNVGGAHLSLRLVDEYAVGPTSCSLATLLRTGTSALGQPWTAPVPRPTDSDYPRFAANIVVQGASVELSGDATKLAQVVTGHGAEARAGGEHYALGDGQVAARLFPRPPAWLLELKPRPVPHMVDLSASAAGLPFVPRWFLRIAQSRATVVPAPLPGHRDPVFQTTKYENAWGQVVTWLSAASVRPTEADGWSQWLASATASGAAGESS
jgi:hypothetical protein